MRRQNKEQYRQTLKRLLKSCDCPSRPAEEPEPLPDWSERAGAHHYLYVAERDAMVRWETCNAARRALARLDEGTFGLCVDCGRPISQKRLAAMSWAERCLGCQAERETREQLPRAA